MLSNLEVLLNAERSLMDEEEPFNFADWTTCTCGHIYHGVTGKYGGVSDIYRTYNDDVYDSVMRGVTKVLGLPIVGHNYADAISDYTRKISEVRSVKDVWVTADYHKVTREHSLKVIREAIEKIREMDLIKIRDAHNYEVVNASQGH